MWYYPGDAFDVVYAASDLHGDVDVAVRLFTDVLHGGPSALRKKKTTNSAPDTERPTAPRVVTKTSDGAWEWVATRRACVVICGDVVDRSRGDHEGGSPYGENTYQYHLPDDLFLLRLLNEWSDLARAAVPQGAVLRLLGNHEVFCRSLVPYGTHQSALLLYMNVEQHLAHYDIYGNRTASFTTPHGAFFDAVWHPGSVRLFVQIGHLLFVHAAITPQTLSYIRTAGCDPTKMLESVRAYVLDPAVGLDVGISDVLQHRTLAENAPLAGFRTRTILRGWARLFPDVVPPHTLVVGHCAQVGAALDGPARLAHATCVNGNAAGAVRFEPPLAPVRDDPGQPRMNASVDADGHAVLWRIDAGQSRAWWTVDATHPVIPQALELDPESGALATLMDRREVTGPPCPKRRIAASAS